MRKSHNKLNQNKTYKIYPIYIYIFESCLSVFKRDSLTEYFIKDYFNYKEIVEVPRKNKYELCELMIDELVKSNNIHKSNELFENERMLRFKRYLDINSLQWDGRREPFNIRISQQSKRTISKLSEHTDTIGEILELAIANFIYLCNQPFYDLIVFTFEHYIDDIINNNE